MKYHYFITTNATVLGERGLKSPTKLVNTSSLSPLINPVLRMPSFTRNRDSSVCIKAGYGLNGRGSILDRGKRFLFTP
jgi:hypothetical protein